MNGVYLPAWPAELPRRMRPVAHLLVPKLKPYYAIDLVALKKAALVHKAIHALQAGGLTQTWAELIFSNRANYAAHHSSAAEGSLLGGQNVQPVIPALYFDANKAFGRAITILASGVLGTTGTPTIIFQVRLGTTAGSTFLGGTSVGVSAAINTQSGVANKQWELRLDLTCNSPGLGTGNATLEGAGFVTSPGGFASPFTYPLQPTTPDTATWTVTIDGSLTQYVNLSATWSAASPSNTITCKRLWMLGWN